MNQSNEKRDIKRTLLECAAMAFTEELRYRVKCVNPYKLSEDGIKVAEELHDKLVGYSMSEGGRSSDEVNVIMRLTTGLYVGSYDEPGPRDIEDDYIDNDDPHDDDLHMFMDPDDGIYDDYPPLAPWRNPEDDAGR